MRYRPDDQWQALRLLPQDRLAVGVARQPPSPHETNPDARHGAWTQLVSGHQRSIAQQVGSRTRTETRHLSREIGDEALDKAAAFGATSFDTVRMPVRWNAPAWCEHVFKCGLRRRRAAQSRVISEAIDARLNRPAQIRVFI